MTTDLNEVAHKILNDPNAPPALILAAWHYRYGWTQTLPQLVAHARRPPSGLLPSTTDLLSPMHQQRPTRCETAGGS